MLKEASEVKLEQKAQDRLQALLADVPFIRVEGADREIGEPSRNREADFLIRLKANGRPVRLICEVKGSGQPRYVRTAIAQLRNYIEHQRDAYGVVIAPYFSPASQQICRNEDICFVDFEGNCRLVFNGVFIERAAPLKPSTARRELKSIFSPKSAQVLRVLLRKPDRRWKVVDLAKAARVSLGQASNVRNALIDREWAESDSEGLFLTKPDALLDSWRDAYVRSPGQRLAFYTPLHGSTFQERIAKVLENANLNGAAMLASFSAAQWLAPYARVNTNHFYANEIGLTALREGLELSSSARGENVIVMQVKDNGLFNDAVEPVPSIRCTSAVQTYLDLSIAGERGKEAAEHLRVERLKWQKT
jgi:transcriptional regulator with AbiEi antitoxin domain of type IV toxin-antitoxin system